MIKENATSDNEFEGYCIDLLNDLKDLMGFEYEIYVTPDNLYGNMDENMEWNGMIKELIDKVAIKELSDDGKEISCLALFKDIF